MYSLFFTEYSAITFSLWLIWLLVIDVPYLGPNSIIGTSIAGLFAVNLVTLLYLAVQAYVVMQQIEDKATAEQLRLDSRISRIPQFVLGFVIVLWMPHFLETSYPFSSHLPYLKFKPETFDVVAAVLAFIAVYIDVNIWSPKAQSLHKLIPDKPVKRVSEEPDKSLATMTRRQTSPTPEKTQTEKT